MADRPPHRYASFVAALALLAPSAISACSNAEAQGRRGPPRPPVRRPPVVSAARTDASVPADARATDSGAVATRPNGCPLSLSRAEGTACALSATTHCYDGPEHCVCATSDAGARRWRCETVFLGPLPPPELPS